MCRRVKIKPTRIVLLHWMHRYKKVGVWSVLHTRQSRTPTGSPLKRPPESMYQSSESRWDRNPLRGLWSQSNCTEAGFSSASRNTGRRHNGGQLWRGKQKRLHLSFRRLLCGRCWWCSGKYTWGCIQRTNADRQRLAGGPGKMSGASDLPWVRLSD